ncbi:metalloregulator ArsR/SmtB family transcription factor [Erythrobacter sp.]|uniref:ArsR/SmtB family transcription factor n=1 Tax=Erythrobacter sp. TaxID=1042 RepID=UPI001B115929|nr:metalloregulator ArsR/SmtB family transcription factor [Erythrobacter sp.]MBO6526865.1 winged helix-turn-helix transcriptional regulator [Erythrobacter sp.]MBO6528538.1 winged helix-turn-helix transcriptional regulator [Erythrobacter sp.]
MVERFTDSDSLFRALSDGTRRAMLERLSQRDMTVGALAEPFEMSLAAASKHIGVLEEAGLIRRQKRGRERVCSLDPRGLEAVRDWAERYVGFWNERLDALDRALKEQDDE